MPKLASVYVGKDHVGPIDTAPTLLSHVSESESYESP